MKRRDSVTLDLRDARSLDDLRRLPRFQRGVLVKGALPLILLVSVLAVAAYHFHNILKTPPTVGVLQTAATYNSGGLTMRYAHTEGLDRPGMLYDGWSLLSYAEPSSTLTLDGETQPLWNAYHGVKSNPAARQLYTTISGDGWQLLQVATLVNDATVTVAYTFIAQPQAGQASPAQVTLSMPIYATTSTATNTLWYQPIIQDATFQAQLVPVAPANAAMLASGPAPQSVGTLTLALSGPGVAAGALTLGALHTIPLANGAQGNWATALTTRLTLAHPPADQPVALGTETITFQPANASSTGGPLPIVTPAS
ncbi:MAG: hypothetical protein ABI068_15640 [Ktedonobacterales bacterium]